MSISILRPKPQSPVTGLPLHSRRQCIQILHPGYPDGQNILLNLYAFDLIDSPNGGIQWYTAFLACAIISGNRWDGFFTALKPNELPIQPNQNLLLEEKTYYFHVPPPESCTSYVSSSEILYYKYPICPSFKHWKFPHGSLPPMWPGQSEMENEAENKTIPTPPTPSKITSAVLMRDERCHMTSCVSYLESAHLCPRSESEWFESQQMAQYNLDFELSNGVDDTSNRIALRKDIHAAFDRNDFVFTRKHDSWAIHFLKLTPEWGPIYHNTPVKFAQGISHTSLLTRFAFSIFPLVKGFLLSTLKDRPRAILVRTNGQADPSEKNLEYPAIQGLLTETQKQHGRTKRRKEGDDVLEPVEAESRRMADVRRTSSVPDTSNYSRTFTPIGTSPATSVQPDANRWCPPRFEHIKDVEARHFAILRSTERRKRRPAPEQMCCDYNAAEEAGSELCSRCLGWEGEYEEDRFEEDGFEVYD